jgi:N-acetylmuramoyl-L-alanine amidase
MITSSGPMNGRHLTRGGLVARVLLALVTGLVDARASDGDASVVVVAIDAGHGGTNLGAAGPTRGVYEKAVTLALAKRLRALLEVGQQEADARPSPRFAVVLCRDADRLVAIRARARCAEASGARLFLSLHTNAVPAGVAPGSQHGFEVFVLGPREIEDDAALAALRASDDAEAVWQSHRVRVGGERSLVLARDVADRLTRALGSEARRGVKQSGAALDVLRGAGTAAALVEVGFLDDPEEGARLSSWSGREPIARALADAIRDYVADGAAPKKAVGGLARAP